MAERFQILQNLKMVISASGQYQPMRSMQYVLGKLTQKDLIKNLVACLVRNTNWSQEFKGLLSDTQRQKCFGMIQKEQLNILEIVFTLSLQEEVKIEHVE